MGGGRGGEKRQMVDRDPALTPRRITAFFIFPGQEFEVRGFGGKVSEEEVRGFFFPRLLGGYCVDWGPRLGKEASCGM